uniref:Uncharacterized protein n=1 Tax=Spongospora subterranea TaxID=70186 RepID=A0A0H5R7E9_9EUKA|eukprot:CRZ09682.1 hypothetical protein [Spongospora subterranea]
MDDALLDHSDIVVEAPDSPPPLYDAESERNAISDVIDPKSAHLFSLLLTVMVAFSVFSLITMYSPLTIGIAAAAYAIYLAEAVFVSSTFRALLTKPKSPRFVIDRIRAMKAASPILESVIQAYHYEDHDHEILHIDHHGHRHRHRETHHKRVNTHVAKEPFSYDYFSNDDDAESKLHSILPYNIVRLCVRDQIVLGDEYTRMAFNDHVLYVRMKYGLVDSHIDYSQKFYTPDFAPTMIMANDCSPPPWWMTSYIYIFLAILLLAWPYRMLFQSRCVSLTLNLKKSIFRNQPAIFK